MPIFMPFLLYRERIFAQSSASGWATDGGAGAVQCALIHSPNPQTSGRAGWVRNELISPSARTIDLKSRYPRIFPVAQLAPSADAPAPHRLRQLSPAASLMPAGPTVSVEKKKTDPECGFGAPGTKIETRPSLSASV